MRPPPCARRSRLFVPHDTLRRAQPDPDTSIVGSELPSTCDLATRWTSSCCTAGHSARRIEKQAVSRIVPSLANLCARSTPSNVAPRRVIARRDCSLRGVGLERHAAHVPGVERVTQHEELDLRIDVRSLYRRREPRAADLHGVRDRRLGPEVDVQEAARADDAHSDRAEADRERERPAAAARRPARSRHRRASWLASCGTHVKPYVVRSSVAAATSSSTCASSSGSRTTPALQSSMRSTMGSSVPDALGALPQSFVSQGWVSLNAR